MNDFRKRLAAPGVLITDGAWGTELARRGLPAGVAPESWNIERPDDVRAVAAGYVAAGADVILTNTFGGTRIKLAKTGLDAKAAEVNRLGARLSKEAALVPSERERGDRALVFASIGPTGELVEPLGELTEDAAVAAFAEQVRALVAGGVDGFCIESFSDLVEAKAALRAVRSVGATHASPLPAVVSLTFEKGARGYATMMGVTPERAAKELEAAGADVVGANCGVGSAQAVDIARLMKSATSLPLWIKPNAGLPRLVGGQTVFPESPEEFVANVREIVRAGAKFVGGCCGSTPAHIRRLAASLL
jgi:5-methyltetrahydrofolate--homocysteine methyltransferase